MPSTYSPALRLELIGNGEQAANWGNTTNTNLGTLLEQAIAGVQSIAMTDADYTLVSGNGISDEARNAVITMTGTLTATRNVVVPTSEKFYAVRNSTTNSQSIIVKTSAGTGVTLANGLTQLMYCDGTNVVAASAAYNASTGSIEASSAVLSSAVISGSSSGNLVRITQTGSGNALVVEDEANPDSTPFVVDSSGNVGIGTSSPTSKLDVNGVIKSQGATVDAFPSGTVLVFAQTAAPTGWTKSTTHNDKALRVVSGSASSGGSVAFTTAFASQAVSGTVGDTTLTTAQIPAHNHGVNDPGHVHILGGSNLGSGSTGYSGAPGGATPTNSAVTGISIQNAGGGGSHTHSFTGTAINLAVQYVDVILATKN